MPDNQTDRICLVEKLINLSIPVAKSRSELSKFGWDYEGQPVLLSKAHVMALLNRFIADEISSDEVEEWANAIECREDIELDTASGAGIRNIMHELANPVLTQPLSPGRAAIICRALLANMGATHPDCPPP